MSLTLEFDRAILAELRDALGSDGDSRPVLDYLFSQIRLDGRQPWAYRDGDVAKVESKISIPLTDVIGESATGRLSEYWLGHNGIRVATTLEAVSFPMSGELTLAGSVVAGHVCLFDDLRPDVSVSRESLREISFEVRSAVQLAVRRAVACHLGAGEDDLVQRFLKKSVFPEIAFGDINAGDITSDVLMDEWRKEQIIKLPSADMVSVENLCDAAKKSSVELSIPIFPWTDYFGDGPRPRDFYAILISAMLEHELDVEIRGPGARGFLRSYRVVVRPPAHVRPPGIGLMPPLAGADYGSVETVIRPGYPANLSNPMIRWFFENALEFHREYPALFVQFRAALAVVSSGRMSFGGGTKDGAELMNAVMDRIRRACSDVHPALHRRVYLGEGNVLLQDI